jgi:hypothetical protein
MLAGFALCEYWLKARPKNCHHFGHEIALFYNWETGGKDFCRRSTWNYAFEICPNYTIIKSVDQTRAAMESKRASRWKP